MEARSPKGAKTRLRIIRAAAELFHKQGVRATSTGEVLAASQTGKGQFYHYFESKRHLIHEVLQTYLCDIQSAACSSAARNIATWEDLERWFKAQVERQKMSSMVRGCPFGTIGNELTEEDDLIRQDLGVIFEVFKSRLLAFFVREKANGGLKETAREDWLAEYCIVVLQGAMLIGKIRRDSKFVERAVAEALAYLHSYRISSLASGERPMPAR